MRRRTYLSALGSGMTVGLAGCGAPAGETEDGATETETAEATEAAAETTAAGTDDAETPTETTAGETDGDGTATGTTAGAAPNTVSMSTDGSEYLFDPVGLYVETGETITWVNESGSHSSTAYTQNNPQSEVRRIPEEAEGWNSEILSEEGAEFSHTFDVAGTYDYYCIPHKTLGMVARLVVDEPSGVEGDPPDGPVPSEQQIVEQGVVTQEEFDA